MLVGGIGVMNIMLVSVSERVREIGLRKALGAAPGVIRTQFLMEACLLSLAGGILGLAVGYLGAALLPSVIGQPVTISVPASLGALGVALVVGSSPASTRQRVRPARSNRRPAQRVARHDQHTIFKSNAPPREGQTALVRSRPDVALDHSGASGTGVGDLARRTGSERLRH